jgi:hypothetical protein
MEWLGAKRVIGVVLMACAVAWSPWVSAQNADVNAFVAGKKALKRGTIQSLRGHKISIGGRRTVSVGEVADRVFAEQNAITAQLKQARSGLKADPNVTAEVVELDDATVLSSSTSVTIEKPDVVQKSAPELTKVRGTPGPATLGGLSAKAKADLATFKAQALKFATGHPLRQAAESGDQALLDAIAAGKGDYTVTTTIVIPKRPLARDASGRARAPTQSADGSFDFGSSKGSAADESKRDEVRTKGKAREPKAPKTKEKGRVAYDADFLTGFTRGDSLEWTRRWDVPTGFFRVKATAWYDYGLRVPVRVHAVMKPERIETKGASDVESKYDVSLDAKTLDADAAFYRDVGLSGSDVADGKELVLRAGFSVTLTLRIMGIDINQTIPKGAAFDFGQNFRPPFGDCGTKCGFDVWVPSSITHTGISILGVLKGEARFGVNVSGNGAVGVDYGALFGNDPLKSWHSSRSANSAENRHDIVFSSPKQTHTFFQNAPAIAQKQGGSKSFGFALSKPKYTWKLELTPGVRADIEVNAKPIFKSKFTIGPLWLHDLAIRLGTINLRGHDGTADEHLVRLGTKTFTPK